MSALSIADVYRWIERLMPKPSRILRHRIRRKSHNLSNDDFFFLQNLLFVIVTPELAHEIDIRFDQANRTKQ